MGTTDTRSTTGRGTAARQQLLALLPFAERRLDLAGVSTAVLEAGGGPPMILLHGPGEFAESWLRVVPDLMTTHRIIAPDLPGHGASKVDGALEAGRVLAWVAELVEKTCTAPPVLVGRTAGGAVAARFVSTHAVRVAQLVLVDALGLAPFTPAPEFGRALQAFLGDPTRNSYELAMRYCSFDLDRVREQLGDSWEPLAAYAVDRVATPSVLAATHAILTEFGGPIPTRELRRIAVPTALIWGRHDLATSLSVAEQASARYGWPLHVIENAADDPTLDQPEAFTAALRAALRGTSS
jgi:pimeloyl-ACP methyl ester carboxylesterase